MANYTKNTKISAKNFVTVSSRYAKYNVIYYTENNLLTFPVYKKKPYVPNSNDKYAVITPGSEYRPDLVSQSAYGTVDFWWKIMEANNLKDIFEFKAGLNIVIPNAVLG